MDTPERHHGSWSKTPRERLASSTSRSRTRTSARPAERPRQSKAAAASSTPPSHVVRVGGVEFSVRVLFIVVMAILLLLLVVPSVYQWLRQEQDRNDILAELEKAKAEQAEVQRQIELWDNPDYIAAQARERLGYVMPGETQYSVVDPGPGYQDAAQAAASQPKGPPRPWVQNFAVLTLLADTTDDIPATKNVLRTPVTDGSESADTPASHAPQSGTSTPDAPEGQNGDGPAPATETPDNAEAPAGDAEGQTHPH